MLQRLGVSSIAPGDNGIDRVYTVAPNIRSICGVLMNLGVSLDLCLLIYAKGIEVLEDWPTVTHLLILATYRRQVTESGDIEQDKNFMVVARTLRTSLTSEQWRRLAGCMPKDTAIYRECWSYGA
jgi:hypothetical protein